MAVRKTEAGEVPALVRATVLALRGREASHYGRPSKFTKAVREVLIEAARKGNYATVGAQLAGISITTYKRWVDEGYTYFVAMEDGTRLKPRERELALFVRDLLQAEAESEVGLLEDVRDQVKSQWAAGMTILERRHPSRWKRRDQTELVGAGGGPIEVKPVDTPERLATVVNVLIDAGALPAGLREALAGAAGNGQQVIDAQAEPVHPAQSDR